MVETNLTAEREKWDKVSATYQDTIDPLDVALASEIGAALLPVLAPGASLLEAGCGSGHLSAMLAGMGFSVTLADFSPVALDAARRVFAKAGLEARCHEANLFELDRAGLPRFDCVWNSGVLEHYSDGEMIAALRQMAGASNGLVMTLVPNGRSVIYRAFRQWARRAGVWAWGEENLLESMAPFYESAGLEVISESTAGAGFIEYFARRMTGSNEFSGLISEMLAAGALPADQNYLVLTLGRVAEVGSGRAGDATHVLRRGLEEKNRAIARLAEALGDREGRLIQNEKNIRNQFEEQLNTLRRELDGIRQALSDCTSEAAGLRENLAMARQALAEQKVAYEDKLRALSEQYRELMARFDEAGRAAAAQADSLRENLAMARQALAEQKIGYEEKLRELSERYRELMARFDEAGRVAADQGNAMRENLAMARQALAEQKVAYEDKLRILSEQYREQMQRCDEALRAEAGARQELLAATEAAAQAAGLNENLAMTRQALAEQKMAYEEKIQEFSKHYQALAQERDNSLANEAVACQRLCEALERLNQLREEIRGQSARLNLK